MDRSTFESADPILDEIAASSMNFWTPINSLPSDSSWLVSARRSVLGIP